jgi:hypothetical protein
VISGRDGVGGADLWSHNSQLTEGLDLAVQVGEDTYFFRDNAIGVADVSQAGPSLVCYPHHFLTRGVFTPRSRFLERRPIDISVGVLRPSLVHFCSAEVVAQAIFSRCAVVIKDDTYPAPASRTHSKPQEGPNDEEDLLDGFYVLLILDGLMSELSKPTL